MTSTQWTKEKFLQTSSFSWQTCTLHAGVKLDVFSEIGDRSVTAEELSGRLKTDGRNLAILLNALTAMELLVHDNDVYRNTDESARFLSKDSPDYIGFILMHHHHLLDSWRRIDEAVLSGEPVRTPSSHGSEEQIESFLMGMFNLAMSTAPVVAEKIDLSQATNLLDLGGGPGTWAIHFCLVNPRLRAKVFDLPSSESFARRTIDRFKMADRVGFIAGDFLDRDLSLEEKFDVAWLSHILHGEGPEEAEYIIEKALSFLKPGGRILIHEFILNENLDGPLFSINMMVGTPKGQSYSEKQLTDMLRKKGVTDIHRIDFTGPSQSGILAGTL